MKNLEKFYLDEPNRKILHYLQRDSSMSIKDLSERVNLSPTPCWKRVRSLTESGVIRANVALLDQHMIGAAVTVFIAIKTDQHNMAWTEKFAFEMSDIPEIMEVYRMSGEVDYLLRAVVPSIAEFDHLYKKIISRIDLTDVTSTFAMEQMKYTTALPV